MNIDKTNELTLNKINAFYKFLCDNFTYGCLSSDKKPITDFNNFNEYTTISPKDFEKYKIGVCWDYVAYEDYFFKKHFPNIKYNLYFMEIEDYNSSTHTWLSFNLNDKWYIFEVSWYSHRGISEFESEDKMINFYKKELLDYSKDKCHKATNKYMICRFKQWNDYKLSCSTYMNRMWENKDRIETGGNYNMTVHEDMGTANESLLISQDDIYYNKDKFDSGEINLCFITGHSGSGKSTMGKDMKDDDIEHCDLDDIVCTKDKFTMNKLKEHNDLFYSFFNGTGKEFYLSYKEIQDKSFSSADYEDKMFPKFIHYAMKYAKIHKDKKFIIEGVSLFSSTEDDRMWFHPSEFKDYAFYIKGTSMIISKHRAALRDAKKYNKDKFEIAKDYIDKLFFTNNKWYLISEKQISTFRKYFSSISDTPCEEMINANEATIYSKTNKYPVFIITMHTGTFFSNVIKKFTKDTFSHACISFNPKLDPMYSFGNKTLKGFDTGFIVQRSTDEFYKLFKSYYNVYVMYVDKNSYTKMQERMKYFTDNTDKLQYDVPALITCAAKIPTEKREKFFCSKFVMDVIGKGHEISKVPSLWTPQQIADMDDISLVNSGDDFSQYDYKETLKSLKDIKKESLATAIESMLVSQGYENCDIVNEGYIMNYFKNKRLIKKIGKQDSPEVSKEILDNIIKELSNIFKNNNKSVYVNIIEFDDETKLAIITSKNKDEINPASAYSIYNIKELEDINFIIEVNPIFEKFDIEEKRYILLHEIGHCRLRHNVKHSNPFMMNYTDYRIALARKGKSMYTEVNADLYAILNGASVYSILKLINNDPVSDMEIGSRFVESLKKSQKMNILTESYEEMSIATESIKDFFKSIIDKKESIMSWKEKIFTGNSFVGRNFINPTFSNVKVNNGIIEIYGLRLNTLTRRIRTFYEDKAIENIFLKKYNAISYKQYLKKRISKKQIAVDYLYIPEFFALELVTLFTDLGKRFNDIVYKNIASLIYNNTWLSESDNNAANTNYLDISNISKLNLDLTNYQKEFVERYPLLKAQLNLNGYILSFEQGMGKTITAVALAECLNKDHIYIVCPNSLKPNWMLEIKKYYSQYSENEDLWREEVIIVDAKQSNFNPGKAKYIICNNESISKIFPYIIDGNNMLIVDESQNFRNLQGKRTKELLQLRDKVNCKDVLIMSGTPIKAVPSEIVPALLMIDPSFTIEAATIYTKAFKLSTMMGTSIVESRFGKIIYRKEKDELPNLPNKYIDNLSVTIQDSHLYETSYIKEIIGKRFTEIYTEEMKHDEELKDEFIKLIQTYSTAPKNTTDFYIKCVIKVTNRQNAVDLHELDQEFMSEFLPKYVKPNLIKIQLDRLKYLETTFIRLEKHCIGLAIGEILPKARRDMFVAMYEQNKDEIIQYINSAVKKTVIFSQFKDVVKYIYNDLNNNGIETVMITGEIKDRLTPMKQFKEDDNTRVIIATSQTMGVGVTLTEANQMFFFGPPWRSTDFDQCSDRIHRIGQTDDVHIYTVVLDTQKEQNLSTRMESILQWSQEMFDSCIKKTETDDIDNKEIIDNIEIADESLANDFFMIEEMENMYINYTEIPSNLLSKMVKINKYYNDSKAIAIINMPRHLLLQKDAIISPLDGKLSDMQFTELANSILARPNGVNDYNKSNIRFVKGMNELNETWSICTIAPIKKGEILCYDATTEFPSFYNDDRI